MSRLFASDDQNTEAEASASVLSLNIQGLSPLRLTGSTAINAPFQKREGPRAVTGPSGTDPLGAVNSKRNLA